MTRISFFQRLMDKKHWFFFGGGIILFCGYYFLDEREESGRVYEVMESNEVDVAQEEIHREEGESETSGAEEQSVMMVDVKGAVKKPGVYPVSEGERVVDVVAKAGGLTEDADDTKINLSQKVSDEMVIYVPRKDEDLGQLSVGTFTNSTGGSSSSGSNKVNINTASREELQTLPGIGPQKANAIIEYRESQGPFQTIEEIMNVSGIGEKSFEKLQDLITVK
ncbi:MAG: helix-hairpin-helix domain-containing protein [Caldibacillus sp.]